MSRKHRVYVVAWNDDPTKALAATKRVYPRHDLELVGKKELRHGGFFERIRRLRGLRGNSLVFCFRSLDDMSAPRLMAWMGLFHRCAATVFLDETGRKVTYGRWSLLRLTPLTAVALLCDFAVLLCSWIWLKLSLRRTYVPAPVSREKGGSDIAYLFPYPMFRFEVGGAISHIQGFLSGLKGAGAAAHVYTAVPLTGHSFHQDVIGPSSRPFFFWESRAIGYNWRFRRAVRALLKNQLPRAFYQRNGRFVVAGALLARGFRLPLILEYNNSETWIAQNWDPCHFRSWLKMCEQYSLLSASLITVVSEPLRRELLQRGIPEDRILVNPNAVDPQIFRPECGGREARTDLGFGAKDVVIGFVGTFSYWHGVDVLKEAARQLLEMSGHDAALTRLRFLLIGDGPLRADAAAYLQSWVSDGQVVFTGAVDHERVPAFLDAADIFLSPHIPLADGTEFFGSPTKIFEYMAMSKAIIASNLGQIGTVLRHSETGWLVMPGSIEELVVAVIHLARHPDLRARLGRQAREDVLARHTWKNQMQELLARLGIAADTNENAVLDKQSTKASVEFPVGSSSRPQETERAKSQTNAAGVVSDV